MFLAKLWWKSATGPGGTSNKFLENLAETTNACTSEADMGKRVHSTELENCLDCIYFESGEADFKSEALTSRLPVFLCRQAAKAPHSPTPRIVSREKCARDSQYHWLSGSSHFSGLNLRPYQRNRAQQAARSRHSRSFPRCKLSF